MLTRDRFFFCDILRAFFPWYFNADISSTQGPIVDARIIRNIERIATTHVRIPKPGRRTATKLDLEARHGTCQGFVDLVAGGIRGNRTQGDSRPMR